MYSQAKFIDSSIDEYLQFDLESIVRHEYIAGQVYPVLKDSHNLKVIAENLFARLRTQLYGSDCQVFTSDMKIRIEPINAFYYPEVSVVRDSEDKELYFKTRPCLIAEVISPITERIDRNEKLFNYRQLPSLQEYILIHQSEMKVELYRKFYQNNWFMQTLTQDNILQLQSVDVEITMAEIYEDVELGKIINH
ncbi:MAG: Uma2 family endonuclease [Richelia sp. RM2_1_2]|nr:Uma2 family endonuclease [Richelia sp. SM1_7_0]NJN07764.1 Uma2 family endonuclease [Richelia sp. RM1_1_1]NJO26546.1 Uma2 family endonuclease [Richelia sp. SL_2_1]NJO57796.1 Uma2 family endonuclease [Richelia sp. RM2_1_2]NJS16418.1 Uma2 family endonuclease [Nostocaceae cyanobacterium CSU_2_110]